jgi:N-acetyl-gamma-glutamyl-phosphate reductase
MVNVAILGATGYGGIELIRLLQAHPQVRLAYLHSESYAGQRVCDVYPQLAGVETRLRDLGTAAVAAECKFALLAVPAGKSMEVAPKLLEAGVRVVDVSPDFRLKDPALYPTWYKLDHTHPELLKEAVFGIPEWYREAMSGARLVAAPGCYSTAAILALAPLAAEKLIDSSDIVADGKTGISGAGRTSLKLQYHFPEASEDVSPYSVGGHRHLPEMVQVLEAIGGSGAAVTFTPHLVPMSRGILMTCYVRPKAGVGMAELREAMVRRYQDEPFVHVLPEGVWPHTKWAAGTNQCFLALGTDRGSGRAIVVSAIDNLGKGMSGQMVQCLNVMLGVDETTALGTPATYP